VPLENDPGELQEDGENAERKKLTIKYAQERRGGKTGHLGGRPWLGTRESSMRKMPTDMEERRDPTSLWTRRKKKSILKKLLIQAPVNKEHRWGRR